MSNHKSIRPIVNGKYIPLGPNDTSKRDIPKKERCEDFDEIWNRTYEEVMEYWEWVPVKDIDEIPG